MKNLTVTEMNNAINNNENVAWRSYVCKESALAGRVKRLASKVNAICKEMDLDPDEVTVEFENVKPSGKPMYDVIHITGNSFSMNVEFYNASKNGPGCVSMDITNDNGEAESVNCETWKELKSILSEYVDYAQGGCEDCVNDPEDEDTDEDEVDETDTEEEDETDAEEEDEIEECDENCSECEDLCEDFDPEQVED